MFRAVPLTVIAFLIGMSMLGAQISFSVPNLGTCTNKISVPISVTGFNNITAFSYSMEWDETILKFDSVGAFNLQHLDPADFGTSQAPNGILTTAWIDNDASGETKSNGTVLYRMYFTVLGPIGSNSTVEFKNVPTQIIAAAGFPPVLLTVTTNNGSVHVGDITPPTISCPAPVSISVPGTSAVVNGIAPTAADNCGTPTVTYATTGATTLTGTNNASGRTFNLGVTTVTYTATDGQGNTSNCSFTVTVNQVLSTVFFNATSDTAFCNDNHISIAITTANFNNITAFSFSLNWADSVIEYSSLNFTGFLQHLDAGDFGISQAPNGVLTVAWVDDDGSGETLVNGDTLFIINFDVVGSPSDNAVITFSNTPTSIIAGQGFPPVSLPVITNNGNAAIVDDLPSIACPANISLNANNNCTAVATWVTPTATDDCGPATVVRTAGPASGSQFSGGTTTITYTATDNALQTNSCSFTVTVVDITPPNLTCPANQTLSANASCAATLPNYTTLATATDNCSASANIIISQFPTVGTIISDTTEIMLIATDEAGLKDTCYFDVNLVDNTLPSITCPAPVAVFTNSNSCVATGVVLGVPSTSDNCGVNTTTNNAPASFPLGSTTVTWTVTDIHGNSNTCQQAVTVTDNVAPTISCPPSVAVGTDAGVCQASSVALGTPTTSDNCGVNPATNNAPAIFAIGTTTVTWTVTDVNGNSNTCSQAVTVTDDENPSIICPADQTIAANANCQATLGNYIGLVTVTDNCSAPGAISLIQQPAPGTVISDTTEVMLIATDQAGLKDTCFFDVNFVDVTLPVVTCPANVTVDNDAGECSAIVTLVATAIDNCGLVSLTDNAPVGDEFPIGSTTVTFTATDLSGNVAACQVIVLVNDTILPVITCPADISQANDLGNCSAIVTWAMPTVVDNCTNVTITCIPPSGTEFPVGDSTVVCIVEDPGGNTDTCSFVVTVFDNEAPTTQCVADTTILVPVGTVDTIIDNIYLFSLSDNCSIDTLHYNLSGALTANGDGVDVSGTAFPVGTTTVTYFAEDNADNIGSCSFDVNIVEDVMITINCSPAQVVDNDTGSCGAVVSGVTGDVQPVAFVQDTFFTITGATVNSDTGLDASGIFNAGVSTVTFYAVSTLGDTVSCTTTITVNDTILPVITCPADIAQANDPGNCSAVVTWAMPTVVDNCTNVTITCIPPSGTEFPVGDSTVVCIVEDPGGNTDTCTFVVKVFDNEPLSMVCVPDTTILVPSGTVDTIVEDIYLFSLSDNCSLDTLYYSLTGALVGDGPGVDVSGTAFPVGTTTVTYFGVDDDNNIGSCSFDVTVQIASLPVITCPAGQTVDNELNDCGAAVNGLIATVTPSGAAVDSFFVVTGATVNDDTGLNANGIYSVGTSTITFYAVGVGGDTVSCSTIVTVNDVESPIFTNCPTDTVTMNNTTDECGVVFNGAVAPLATDNCPGLILSYNFPTGSVVPVGFNTISATATDAAGNATSCNYVLHVIDNQPPKFLNCQNGSTISTANDPNQCGAVVDWTPVVTAMDNCVLLALTETSPGNGDFFPVGNTTVTYTAVDDKGNVATCEINVTVTDTQAPVIVCPSNQPPVNTALNQCSATVNFPQPTATDNCAVISFLPTTPVGPVFNEGVSTVTYEASDAAGNMTTCSFTVTVVDNQFPFIPNMPADITAYTTANNCGATVSWAPPSFPIDNCGVDTFGPSGGAPGDFFGVGTHDVNYVAMDINGNITVETLTITVLDTMPPVVNCPTGISVTVDGTSVDDPDDFLTVVQQVDCDNIQLNFGAITASDPCGVATLTQTTGLPSGSSFPIGANNLTFVATDNYGNITNCSFTINVVDYQVAPATVSQGIVCEGSSVTFNVGSLPGATYTWTFGGNVVSNSQTFMIANAALNQSGIYTVVVSTAFCDIQFTTELNVTAVPVVTIDANDILCTSNNTPLTLTGVNSSTANVTNWTWTFPNGTMPTGQTQVIQNPTPSNSGNYCVTATTQFGCSATACQQVDVFNGPQTPVINGTAGSYCLGSGSGSGVTLFGQLYSGNNVTYHWYSIPALGSGIQDINNPIQTVTPMLADTFTYYFYVTVDGCTSDTAEWALVVEAPPTIALQIVGETQCVDGTTNVTLTDNGTGATSWMWSGPNGITLPGNTSSVVLQNVTSSFSGTYKVIAKSDIGCSSTAEVSITFTDAPAPPSLLTANPSSICEGGEVTLTGMQYTGGDVDYIWIGDNIPPNSQNNNVIVVTPSGTGDIEYGFAALVNGCYTDTVTVTVNVAQIPALDIVVSGNTTCVNGTSSITLSTVATGLSNVEWSNANGVLSNANPLVLNNVTANDSGTIYLSATNQQGCIGFGSIDLVITNGIAGLTANYTMIDCELGTVSLEASSIANATYAWFKPNSNQPFALTQNATATNAGDGNYTVVAQANGCTDTASVFVNLADVLDANDKEVSVVVDKLQEFNILANDIYDLDQPFTITILQEPTNGNVSYANKDSIYLYSPKGGFWGSDFIIYEICYTDCPTLCSTAKVTFNVNYDSSECVITTVISPNDDGYNDEFVVSCLIADNAYPLNKLVIFNQWGDKVYDAAPYDNSWKGTNDGKKLPDGTYFYIFQRDPQTPAQKGFVMIYR